MAIRTAIAAAMISRAGSRTVRVKARSLSVASSTPPPSGTAAEMTGVRSGALRTAVDRLARALARSTASGHACEPVDRRLDELVERLRADEGVEAAVERARDVLGPFLRVRVVQLDRSARSAASCRRAAGRRGRTAAAGCRSTCETVARIARGPPGRPRRSPAPSRSPRSASGARAPCSGGCGRRRGRAC